MLTAMQYKTFVWPHNPTTYTLRCTRNLVLHPLPYAGYTVEDLGPAARVMEGSGVFYGKDAYRTFLELAELYDRGEPGLLLHPMWQNSYAWFDLLQAMQEPREDYVRYCFRFVEANLRTCMSEELHPASVRMSPGQTLWDVARQYQTSTEALLRKNPQFASCHHVGAGEVLRL